MQRDVYGFVFHTNQTGKAFSAAYRHGKYHWVAPSGNKQASPLTLMCTQFRIARLAAEKIVMECDPLGKDVLVAESGVQSFEASAARVDAWAPGNLHEPMRIFQPWLGEAYPLIEPNPGLNTPFSTTARLWLTCTKHQCPVHFSPISPRSAQSSKAHREKSQVPKPRAIWSVWWLAPSLGHSPSSLSNTMTGRDPKTHATQITI